MPHHTLTGRALPGLPAAILLFAGCAGGGLDLTPTGPASVPISLAKAAPSTPIAVTVEDQGPSGAYRIQSDGLGEYLNGLQGMQSEIDGFGNLQITPNNLNASTAPQRTLTFDYNSPADPLNTYRPDNGVQWNFKIKSNKVNNGNPGIQDLGVNGNPASGCYNVTIAHATVTTQYTDEFNPAARPLSTYVYITRTAISPATWTMVSDGPCVVNPSWSGLISLDRIGKNPTGVFRGYYNLRFSIRLRAL